MSRQALIVEDDKDLGPYLAMVLGKWGYDPTVLASGKAAAAWARQHAPEVILLDLGLPDADGNEVCQELKLDRHTNLIPIIMVTGRSRAEDRTRGLRVGANSYLTKPFTDVQLHQAIQESFTWRDWLLKHGTEGEIRFHLRSDTRHLEELNGLLASLLHFTCLEPTQIRQLITAVREMGTNAIEWGHQNQVERVVSVTYRIDSDRVTIIIRDSGPGFNPHKLPHAAQEDDPIAHLEVREEMGLREGGFGLMLARGLVDELRYNEAGNEVTLVKRCPPVCESETATAEAAKGA